MKRTAISVTLLGLVTAVFVCLPAVLGRMVESAINDDE